MDKDEFTKFVNKNYKKFYNFAYFYIGNKEDTEDILQETFIKIYNNYSSLKDKKLLENWAIKILRNQCIDFLKTEKTKKYVTSILEFLNLKAPEDNEPHKIYERKEIRTIINDALNKLKIKEKEVFILKYYNNLSIKEISKITGLSESNVKVTLFRSVKKLRKFLKNM